MPFFVVTLSEVEGSSEAEFGYA